MPPSLEEEDLRAISERYYQKCIEAKRDERMKMIMSPDANKKRTRDYPYTVTEVSAAVVEQSICLQDTSMVKVVMMIVVLELRNIDRCLYIRPKTRVN